ncbi:MAG: 2-oxoacid:acceptor oxidoreductase family protein [Leptospiraceae bacterium]|nr:2-oxoacid:acceptor oxidoreductase family protein [Leptospiraceae bacterium]
MKDNNVKYPGKQSVLDGNTAVIMCERESSDAAGAYPITPSTQMGEYWAAEASAGHINISERPLIFIEPEGEHAAAGVTAGLSLSGLRSTNFSSGQGIAYMHESLYAATGKRLTYVLNMGCRAMTKATLNVHAGHDDYHAVDDTGFFQVFAKGVQQAADLNIIAHRIAELALNPGIVAQDGFLTTHVMETLNVPERELIREYLGLPDDVIECPTPAQKLIFGETRRRIPRGWDVDNPYMIGTVQNQESYMQSVAAQRPYFFDHIAALTDQAMLEFSDLTGRPYARVQTYNADGADYLIIGQGSLIANAEAVSDYLYKTRKIKVGIVNLVMFRPFPGDLLAPLLKGRKGVVVLERTDQPLAEDQPIMREVRAVLSKCLENGLDPKNAPWSDYPAFNQKDLPMLYSGAYGLGSKDLQPRAIIGAVENMLPGGPGRRKFYLSIDFLKDKAHSPKQEIQQAEIARYYPRIQELAVEGSENPNLMPEDSITIRIHSVGGWGAIATGKNLTMTLADILDFYVKANPKYGSEKKGQPTTYYLSVAPEPIKINSEFHFVDAVLSPDPNVFRHSNPLAGLKKGGIFIIQSDLGDARAVWNSIPPVYQKIIQDNEIQVFFLDAFVIAKAEASDAELQFRMQGMAFQGAFFNAARDLKIFARKNLNEEQLFKTIEQKLQAKFGSKGQRVVQDNLRVVVRGYHESNPLTAADMIDASAGKALAVAEKLPMMLKLAPQSKSKISDIHAFWEETGSFYKSGQANGMIASPFMSMSAIPASTGVFKDMTDIRFEVPEWNAENCTGCGNCWSVCPDTAIPGLVYEPAEVMQTVLKRMRKKGQEPQHLAKAVRKLEKNLYSACMANGEKSSVSEQLNQAIQAVVQSEPGESQAELAQEFELFKKELNGFKFGLTRPFFTNKDKEQSGKGGFLTINVNPYTCKGCMECVEVCGDDALLPVNQTNAVVDELKSNWDFWLDLPETQDRFKRIDNLEEGIGALETLLMNKDNYLAMSGGDGACLGCAEKTVLHLFTATVAALMQGRVKKHLEKIDGLIQGLEARIQKMIAVDVGSTDKLAGVLDSFQNEEFTAAELSDRLNADKSPVDSDLLKEITILVKGLKDLRWKYLEGTTGRGRAHMGATNATGCSSVWGSTYPVNPYPFPWANHLFQDAPSLAMGVFEGHMQKMADGFKIIRMAEFMAADGKGTRPDLRYFTWRDFSTDEYLMCPPVTVIGGDGALYDIGFQNLSRMMMSGMPIKVMALDTQVYSNTGGQACTSGFTGQISDMATYGKVHQGKEEIRKEIGLIGMAHRTTYIMQGSQSNIAHMMEGFIEGLNSRRPALFNVYCNCPPEHGTGDDVATQQAKLAVESRAYPVVKFNPDKGVTFAECIDLDGNPQMETDWPMYALKYTNEKGESASMELPVTFAEFAVTEARFAKHFRTAPRDAWNDNMVVLHEFLELDADDREGLFPYIWSVNKKNQLGRVLVSNTIVRSCEDRLNHWRILKNLANLDQTEFDEQGLVQQVQGDMIDRFADALLKLSVHN